MLLGLGEKNPLSFSREVIVGIDSKLFLILIRKTHFDCLVYCDNEL